jgi:hypothetical protein
MIRFTAAAVVSAGLGLAGVLATQTIAVAAVAAAQPVHFDSESTAQAGCPNDTVVWLNTNTGIYHRLSVRRYGRTHRGGYVCKSAADAAGDREAQGKDR